MNGTLGMYMHMCLQWIVVFEFVDLFALMFCWFDEYKANQKC
jgi:hypothetical protein